MTLLLILYVVVTGLFIVGLCQAAARGDGRDV